MLAVDPSELVASGAWAAACVRTGTLRRCAGRRTATIHARILAARGDGTAYVLKGAVRTASGQWVFPHVVERVQVDKALNPRNPRDFQTLVAQARDRLVRSAARPSEAEALATAVPSITAADWAALDVATANAVVDVIEADILAIAADPRFERAFVGLGARTQSVAAASARNTVIRGSAGSLSRADRELAMRIGSRRGGVFLTDEYGRRAARYGDQAANIIASGAEIGLDSRAIGAELADALGLAVTGRTANYFGVVANAAISSARSYGELTSMRDAGLQSYVWISVQDERTSDICGFLDGQSFPVADSLNRFATADAAPTPEAAIDEFPWYAVSGGTIYAGPRDVPVRDRTPVARIDTPRSGTGGGSYSQLTAPQVAPGTPVPPAHGWCRSLLEPEF